MNSEEKQKIADAIRDRIETLTNDIALRKEQIAPVSPDVSIGRLSRMEALVEQEVSETALLNSERALKALQSAITRIDDEDFGLCRECESSIPVGRLLLMPESHLCVTCASKLDV